MPFEIVRNDIVNMQVDAIVNTANPKAIIGSGTDASIHKKAGSKLLEARKKIGYISVGDAKITPGFNLSAKYIIHTVGPVWKDGNNNEEKLLSLCYKNSLSLAKDNHCESIAFPLISTGNYGFPKDKALQIATEVISLFLKENDMQVYLVVFDKDSFNLSNELYQSVASYIDENYISRESDEESAFLKYLGEDSVRRKTREDSFNICAIPQIASNADLENALKHLDAGFSETLLHLIDLTGKKDSEIYRKANIDRKLFNKIKNNPNYKPSKQTALAFAIALELDLDETKDFIGRAGYALSHSSEFDVIVEFFISSKIYDIHTINQTLFDFDQSLLA